MHSHFVGFVTKWLINVIKCCSAKLAATTSKFTANLMVQWNIHDHTVLIVDAG